jgi:glycoside/pentoside/hexuronide:cation symporter, GPH family
MAIQSVLQEEKVPVPSRIWVSAADAACSMLNAFATAGALTYYFTRRRGLEGGYAALVWLLFGIWNAVNDPLFGYISDRTKSILGRRIPYIRFGAPLYSLAFILFWLVFPGALSTQTGMFIQMLLALFLFDSLYTAIATSLYVMPYEMAISNKARSSIYVWKILFAVFPLAVPLVLVPIIQPGPGEEAATFQAIMIAFGIAMGLLIFFSTFFYREKHLQQAEQQFGFVKSLVECFKNRSFVIFEVMSFTVIFVQTALMMGVLYYFDEIDVAAAPLYVALLVGIIAGVVTFVRMREKWGVKNSTRYMALVFSFGALVILVLGKMLVPAMVGMFCFGIGFAGGMYLIPLMNGDVVDADEDRTGLRREGMYAGINSFVTKPAISLAQASFLWIIARFGYDNALAKGAQPTSAETGILVAWTLIPAVLLFLSFVSLHWYPLDGPKWNQIKARLSARHEQKEREFLESQGFTPAEAKL